MIKNKKIWLPWLVWGIAACYVLYQFLLQSSISVMVPPLESCFHVSKVGIAFLSSSYFYTYVIMQIPAGMLVDRFGPRRVLSMSILIAAISSFFFAYAHQLHVAEASRMLMGAVTAPSIVAALTLGSNWFPLERFGLIVGLTEAVGMSGGVISQVVLSKFVESSLGWRGTMAIAGFLGILLVMLTWTFVFDYPKYKRNQIKTEERERLTMKKLFSVFTYPQIWIMGLYSGLLFALLSGFASLWSIPFLQNEYHFTLGFAGLLSAMLFIGAAVGSPIIGWMGGVLGNRKRVMLITALITFVLMLLIVMLKAIPVALLFVILFALGFFCSGYVLPYAMASELIDPKLKGTAMGFVNMLCIIIGAPLLQPFVGFLLQTHESYSHALFVFPICFLFGAILTFVIKDKACVV
jgi:MFS family permease